MPKSTTRHSEPASDPGGLSPQKRIWLIGGTSESVELAIALADWSLPCTVSVTTELARANYPGQDHQRVVVGRFDAVQLGEFIQAESIGAIVDASHPFAVQISQLAIATAAQYQIPYLRFERPEVIPVAPERLLEQAATSSTRPIRLGLPQSLNPPILGDFTRHNSPHSEADFAGGGRESNPQIGETFPSVSEVSAPVIELDSVATLVQGKYLNDHRVLLTIGYQLLPQFQSWHEHCQLYTRILPSQVALQTAQTAGFSRDRIFAMHPPVPAALELALWQHWQISLVVTKASGQAGGEAIKRQVAQDLGVTLVIIRRPRLLYPQQTSDLQTAIQFCHQSINRCPPR